MVITIASGKGGTGKTTLAVNLYDYLRKQTLNRNVKLLDCDVEAPNVHLFFKEAAFCEKPISDKKPVWNKEKCIGCGKCRDICRYNAIAKVHDKILIFNDLCHSCGACRYICTAGAISLEDYGIGKVCTVTDSEQNCNLVYGKLNIGESASNSVIKAVKNQFLEKGLNIIDASPGVSSSFIETVEKSDAVILVTEPTIFGLHDLKLSIGILEKLKIPYGIVINRSDNNDTVITDFLYKYDIMLLGRIPFNRDYAETYSEGKLLVDYYPKIRVKIIQIYNNILKLANTEFNPRILEFQDDLILSDKKAEKYFDKNTDLNIIPKELMIVSGKGGTGKTTVCAAFSELSKADNERNIFEDCDVDASNLHLLLKPEVMEKFNFSGGKSAEIKQDRCNQCGVCVSYCHFEAIELTDDSKFKINELKCEGCGLCLYICPNNAIIENERISGQYYISDTKNDLVVHAKLGITEKNSGKLVYTVRTNTARLAEKFSLPRILGDGPPGTGCSVIASVAGTDMVLIVTEPTMSGLHDMKRTLELAKIFKLRTAIIINKTDLNRKINQRIYLLARSFNSDVIAEIPFDQNINEALKSGKNIIEYGKGKACKEIEKAWIRLKEIL